MSADNSMTYGQIIDNAIAQNSVDRKS